MRGFGFVVLLLVFSAPVPADSPIKTGEHRQLVRRFYVESDGLPKGGAKSLVVMPNGEVLAAAEGRVYRFSGQKWNVESGPTGVKALYCSPKDSAPLAAAGEGIWSRQNARWNVEAESPKEAFALTSDPEGAIWALAPTGLWKRDRGWTRIHEIDSDMDTPRNLCALSGERVYVAAKNGLYGLMGKRRYWLGLEVGPNALPVADIRGVTRTGNDHMAAATADGLAVSAGTGWKTLKGIDGLPYENLTGVATGPYGTMWLGSDKGIIRWRGGEFTYIAGGRWLPDNRILALAPAPDGSIWAATPRGISHLYEQKLTLAEKAEIYQKGLESRNRRHGFVTVMQLPATGKFEGAIQELSDNDGLWTALYVAAQSYRYAATRSAEARAQASRSMKALLRLESVTGIPGFPARAMVHPDEPQFNTRSHRSHPEWHPSPVEKGWYWKGDTSSDEIDGHYFGWYVHHELAATEEEKRAIRATCKRVTDHILKNGYYLVDHDGKPTTWGVWAPEKLNGDPMWWEERGLNSLEILSHLKVAHHLTGEARYQQAYLDLIRNHNYALNTIGTKIIGGIGHDDQLAFLSYYPLLMIEKDPALRGIYLTGLRRLWNLERVEENPFWNFIYSACTGDPAGREEAVRSLREIPLDLVDWRMENSHRADLVMGPPQRNGQRLIAKPFRWTERRIHKWDSNPYELDGGSGLGEEDQTLWLLPYWLGRYHKLIE